MIIDLDARRPVGALSLASPPISLNPTAIQKSSEGSTSFPSATPPSSTSNDEMGGLLEEIVKPLLSAEEETKKTNRANHFNKEVGKWEAKELKPRHREIMRRILEGATYIEIAEAMGLSTQTIMLVASSAIFKEELAKLDAELNLNIIRRAEDISNEALDKLKVLMRKARSEVLQANCAKHILGIAGYSNIEKKQLQVISGEDVIKELNRQRREAARDVTAESAESTIE